jgi:hypothetical protein
MASRMDRYTKTENTNAPLARSDRNKSLYKQIKDLDSYTNIAGVATIESNNSIDLEKVKELLRSREKVTERKEVIVEEPREEIVEEEIRSYDIKALLSKAKESENNEEKKYRSLSSKQQKVLRELNQKNKENKRLKEMDIEELNELVKTIHNMEPISEDQNTDDDVGLLDDLKSVTMVGDASSIKKIIDEEKELTREFDNMEIDKSFYTSSFGFTQKDFEELKDMNHKIKKDNKFIITLLIILIFLILVGAVFLFAK